MQTKPRGRPRQFDGAVRTYLTERELAEVERIADREQISVSAVCRRLIREGLEALYGVAA